MGSGTGVGEMIDLLTGWSELILVLPSVVSTVAKERATMFEMSRMAKVFMIDGNIDECLNKCVCKG